MNINYKLFLTFEYWFWWVNSERNDPYFFVWFLNYTLFQVSASTNFLKNPHTWNIIEYWNIFNNLEKTGKATWNKFLDSHPCLPLRKCLPICIFFIKKKKCVKKNSGMKIRAHYTKKNPKHFNGYQHVDKYCLIPVMFVT